ncbi:basic amino acid/polyamine antiporter, APA family [Saccharopolyspora antimicrobica]|uniref:APA family basic amino acid/polyamine antiporter n=1 Tax=Saccharopolyspora antimicrobica TaxID=455193 RepID=A0A1I4SJY8_9PSEU|nr:APA family basic amino acid/polyamine antiporter [Saccharopolyspora antimicrobica]SFM64583.1 basic amino acid/polyamine antiporter, APA family [Saccharopolyspora antimicrobica]
MPVEDILTRGERSGLIRRLTGKDLVGFGIGIIIGTGVFTLAGIEAKEHAGPGVVLSFVIGGVVAALAALCYAELSSAVPTAGSAYTYGYATLGELFAWIIGWDLLLEFALGAAVVSRSWSGYVANLLGLPPEWFGEDATVNVGAILIIAALTVIAVIGIRESSWVTNALVVVKVAVCVLVIVAGLFFFNGANLDPFVPPAQPAAETASALEQPLVQVVLGMEQSMYGIGGVFTAAAIVFFAYTGFEALANLGEETKRPKRDLPVGLLGSLIVCTLLYVLVAFVLSAMVDYRQIDEGAPLAAAFQSVGQPWVGALIALGAVTGLTSVMMVELVTIGRIGFAMSRDGLLPPKLSQVHPKWGTPHRMTIGGAVVIMLMAGFIPISELADMVSIGALSGFVIVSLAVPVLRRTKPDLHRPFRVPLSPWLPILSALACLYLMTNLDIITWLRFAAWLALGLLIYFAYGYRNARLSKQTPDTARD